MDNCRKMYMLLFGFAMAVWRTDAGIFGLIPDAAKLMQHMFDRDMFMNEDPYTYNKGINKLLWRNKESYKRTMKEIRRNQAKLDKEDKD